jgi:hypothetical protein
MRIVLILLVSVVALAACNKSPEIHEKNVSVADVAQKVRDAGAGSGGFLDPGQWRAVSTLEEMSMPGMSEAAQAQMKAMTSRNSNATFEYCLTPEEARKPAGKFFAGQDKGNCRYESFDMSEGKMDAVMRCQGQPSGTVTMAMHGTYSSDAYVSHGEMKIEGSPQGAMTMKMRTEAKRIGECTTKTAQG